MKNAIHITREKKYRIRIQARRILHLGYNFRNFK